MTPEPTFPSEFVWGAAASSYQIEGAAGEDGRSESIWDRFCATPGKVRNGETGAVACDFYHRYPEDIALMKELGIDAFRFSIAWPRVVPDGRGRVNAAGLDFYDRLVDELLGRGIEPYVTLYHWDLPQVLEDAGGWPVRGTAEAFVEYAEVVARRLGDRVTNWITLNEPWVISWLGYGLGIHAPGRRSTADMLAAAHHVLLAHGLTVELLRREVPGARVGITLDLTHTYPASDSEADRAAAWEADGERNRWFLDPIFRAEYPADMLERFAPVAPPVRDGDLSTIAAPVDLLGVNYYARHVIRAVDGGRDHVRQEGSVYTDMDWEVSPEGLYDLLLRLRDDYAPQAMYITENGAAFGDLWDHDGQVRDPERQEYIAEHIATIGRAVAAGVPVKGYFVWSLFDNFEWAEGYWKRFGIVYVDYPTLERVPKGSYHWYRDFIARERRAGRPPRVPAAGGR